MSFSILVLVATAVAVAAFVQGTSGLGFALIVGPVVGLTHPGWLPVFLLTIMIPLNIYVLWRERTALDLRGAGWITLARVVSTPVGILLLVVIPDQQLSLLVGVATVLAALASMASPSFTPGRGAYLGAGAVTGITETATGVGGPPLALVYQHRPPAELRATVAACFLAGQVVSLAMLFASGQGSAGQLWPAIVMLPALAAGASLSRLTHHRLNAGAMRICVLGFALVSGIALMLGV